MWKMLDCLFLADSCLWRSPIADISAGVCFPDQRQAVVDPLPTLGLGEAEVHNVRRSLMAGVVILVCC
jgi:hypothetical protein